MFIVQNASNTFYQYCLHTNQKKLIGTEAEFIENVVAKQYVYDGVSCPDRVTAYKPSAQCEEIAFNKNDKKRKMNLYKNSLEMCIYQWTGEYELRTISYMDGYGRFLAPQNYIEQMIAWKKKPQQCEDRYAAKRYTWNRRRNGCSSYSWRGQYFHNVNQARRLESMFRYDEEYKQYCKEYHISPNILNHKDLPEAWWDEKKRRIEGNWKSQYKVKRQYNIHKKSKNTNSIRKHFYENEVYTKEEINAMLEEDFRAS